MSTSLKEAFLEDLARIEDSSARSAGEVLLGASVPKWVESVASAETLRQALTSEDQVEAFKSIAAELVHVALHSALVAIDGGSASAEVGRVRLVDSTGAVLTAASLHEDFVDHLFVTGRME